MELAVPVSPRPNYDPETPLAEDYWIRLGQVALGRYKSSSAFLSIAAIKSFLVHSQDGGVEGGTAPLILKEDYNENPFELGPKRKS